jgi:hypothetical protein
MEVTMTSTRSIDPDHGGHLRAEDDDRNLRERRWQWQRRQLPSCAGREWLLADGAGSSTHLL